MNTLDKEKLIEKDIKAVENRIRHAFNQGYECGLNHGKEQEPLTEVLNEIIADVNRQYKWLINTRYTIRDVDIAFGSIFRTIEKYRKGDKK